MSPSSSCQAGHGCQRGSTTFGIPDVIALNCTSCKKSLDIDDAFAGGVCRCQYCGTIQTVPAKVKSSPRPGTPAAAAAAAAPPQKALYQRKSGATPEATSPAAAPAPPAGNPQPRAARAAHPVTPPAPVESKKNNWLIGLAVGG